MSTSSLGARMPEALLELVDDVCATDMPAEHACLSAGGFAALGLAVPGDFSRPGARPQLLLTVGRSAAAITVAAVLTRDVPARAMIAMGDPDRLSAGAPTSTVLASTDLFAAGHLVESVQLSGDIAVIGPHGGAIERHTDAQVDLLAKDARLRVDAWTCSGKGLSQLRRLHITSDDLSERSFPGLRALLEREHRLAVSFHGFDRATGPGTATPVDVIVGGQFNLERRYDLADQIRLRLPVDQRFEVFVTTSCGDPHAGLSPRNAVNRLADAGGIQIEQSRRLRDSPEARQLVTEAIADALLTL